MIDLLLFHERKHLLPKTPAVFLEAESFERPQCIHITTDDVPPCYFYHVPVSFPPRLPKSRT